MAADEVRPLSPCPSPVPSYAQLATRSRTNPRRRRSDRGPLSRRSQTPAVLQSLFPPSIRAPSHRKPMSSRQPVRNRHPSPDRHVHSVWKPVRESRGASPPHHVPVRVVCPVRNRNRIRLPTPCQHPCIPHDDHLHPSRSRSKLPQGRPRRAHQQPHRTQGSQPRDKSCKSNSCSSLLSSCTNI